MGYKSKYSIGRILKTPTEVKQDRLIAKHQKELRKKNKPKEVKTKIKRNKKKLDIESEAELKKLSYKAFLQTKYWAHVRKLVLKRDGFKCIICNSKDNLQVHHDTYKNHNNELNNLADLMTLCDNCHKEHHYSQS